MLSPNIYTDSSLVSSLFPTFSSPSVPSSPPSPSYRPTYTTSVPIPIKKRTPKVDIGPGPAGEDEPASPISSASSLSSDSLSAQLSTPPTPPQTSIFVDPSKTIIPPRRASALRISTAPPVSPPISASAPNLSSDSTQPTSPRCSRKVRFDKSLTILPYTKTSTESDPIITSKSVWGKIQEAVAGLRGPTNGTQRLSSSWPGPSSSSVAEPRRSEVVSEGMGQVEEGTIDNFEAWKEAKEKCGWEIKVADGGYGGACRLRRSCDFS
ncbi:hypothetical protein HK097_010287 [Rhizophlyctis rosea]|uniref:Uncharacterized protein n=1 Tax=Rhizophlyctis rosea TaxID=64517 RepID=A0AAD5X825_9FUNG|nr:hypothetical protein HK097_010287 [Rhizophlyctis rosea]